MIKEIGCDLSKPQAYNCSRMNGRKETAWWN